MLEKIGKYEVSEQIGVGGFGAVYRGRDPFIKRTVAIKTCQVNDEEIKHRFFREAELAGNLHHRNITTIYDFGVENGIPYIVQEFLTGEDLDKKIKRGDPILVARKVEILMAIADGLGYAHNASIVHRDVKPANVRILEDGTVKVMDFGIAKSLQTESNLTQTGITLGTSAYLAPEQIRGEAIDRRTDIFSLGVLSYELLTYRKPFRGEHLSTVLYKILNETPEPIETLAPDVPPALVAAVEPRDGQEPAERYPTMEDYRQDLHAVFRELAGRLRHVRATAARTPAARSAPRAADDLDTTLATPSSGVGIPTAHITPPSGRPGAAARATRRDAHVRRPGPRRRAPEPRARELPRPARRPPADDAAPTQRPRELARRGQTGGRGPSAGRGLVDPRRRSSVRRGVAGAEAGLPPASAATPAVPARRASPRRRRRRHAPHRARSDRARRRVPGSGRSASNEPAPSAPTAAPRGRRLRPRPGSGSAAPRPRLPRSRRAREEVQDPVLLGSPRDALDRRQEDRALHSRAHRPARGGRAHGPVRGQGLPRCTSALPGRRRSRRRRVHYQFPVSMLVIEAPALDGRARARRRQVPGQSCPTPRRLKLPPGLLQRDALSRGRRTP